MGTDKFKRKFARHYQNMRSKPCIAKENSPETSPFPHIAMAEHVRCFTILKTKLASLKLKVVKATHSHVTQSGMPRNSEDVVQRYKVHRKRLMCPYISFWRSDVAVL